MITETRPPLSSGGTGMGTIPCASGVTSVAKLAASSSYSTWTSAVASTLPVSMRASCSGSTSREDRGTAAGKTVGPTVVRVWLEGPATSPASQVRLLEPPAVSSK
jgi:hypothetical protein